MNAKKKEAEKEDVPETEQPEPEYQSFQFIEPTSNKPVYIQVYASGKIRVTYDRVVKVFFSAADFIARLGF